VACGNPGRSLEAAKDGFMHARRNEPTPKPIALKKTNMGHHNAVVVRECCLMATGQLRTKYQAGQPGWFVAASTAHDPIKKMRPCQRQIVYDRSKIAKEMYEAYVLPYTRKLRKNAKNLQDLRQRTLQKATQH